MFEYKLTVHGGIEFVGQTTKIKKIKYRKTENTTLVQ